MILAMADSRPDGKIDQSAYWDTLIGKGIVMLLFSIGMGIWYAEENQARLERSDQLSEEEYRTALVEEQQAKIRKRPTSWPAAIGTMALVWYLFYLPYEGLCWLLYRGVRKVRASLIQEAG